MVFFIILEDLNKKELDFVFQKFNFSSKFILKYDYGIIRRKNILIELERVNKNSEIYEILKKISTEIIVLIYIQCDNSNIKTKIKKYLYELSKIKPIIRGEDLLNLGFNPGKEFKIKLEKYFLKQLDMKRPTKDMILKG
jgi:tRNA nucleotidyltransferase (CCA-adding enzyme)